MQAFSQPGGKSWCGLFACHVLLEGGDAPKAGGPAPVDGKRVANDTPNIPLTNYTYEMPWHSSDYGRTHGVAIPNTQAEPPDTIDVS
ncbi:MAG: hypothetical protein AB1730_08720 [Myxococcota bacterium]